MKEKRTYRLNGQNNESCIMQEFNKQNIYNDDASVGISTTEVPIITHRKGNVKEETVTAKYCGAGTEKEVVKQAPLVYNVSDKIPPHLTLLFAMQQALLALSASIAVSFLVSKVVCAENNDEIRAKLLSSTLFMNGITTLMMVTVGIRLPLYQGASADYVAPLLAMADMEKDRCNFMKTDMISNGTDINGTIMNSNITGINKEEIIFRYIASLQGSLIAAGAIHFIIGATGLVGVLLRFIGPITIVPTILLIGIYMMKSVTNFTQYHWGIAIMTAAIAIILSLYLANVKMPIPVWTRKKSCHVIRYPLHQVFAILIALVIGWLFCLVLTVSGVFSDDPQSKEFQARTDSRLEVISKATWFYFPYPGNQEADNVITMLLGNPNLCGGVVACFLDNTVPGTKEERGIAEWQTPEITTENKTKYAEGFEVYEPILPKRIKQLRIMKYLPFMPNPKESENVI